MTSAFGNMPCGMWKIFHFEEQLLQSSWFVTWGGIFCGSYIDMSVDSE
jgi:hypothetical protein